MGKGEGGEKQGKIREDVGPGRPPAEHTFKPGQSGNPNGRPPGAVSIVAIIRRMLDEECEDKATGTRRKVAEVIADRLIGKAIDKNDLRALQDIIDRVDGKATQRTEVSGPDGQPIEINSARAELESRLDGIASRVRAKETT